MKSRALPGVGCSDVLAPISGGVWWCLVCVAPADLEDPGEPNPRCTACGKRKCEWHSFLEAEPRLKRAPRLEQAPPEARPTMNQKRLHTTERYSLSQMYEQGWWQCQACDQPTRKNAEDCCKLCGSSRVEFIPPTT